MYMYSVHGQHHVKENSASRHMVMEGIRCSAESTEQYEQLSCKSKLFRKLHVYHEAVFKLAKVLTDIHKMYRNDRHSQDVP